MPTFVVNELANILVNKKQQINKVLPPPAIHGNVKYKFHLLEKEGDFFLVPPADRHNIFTCLRNYNKTNNLSIRVTTRKTKEGIAVIRLEDPENKST